MLPLVLLLRIQNIRKFKHIENSTTVELERDYAKDYLLQLLKSHGLKVGQVIDLPNHNYTSDPGYTNS